VGATPCLTAANDQGFAIDEAEVAYWGLCPSCQVAPSADTSSVVPIMHVHPREAVPHQSRKE
jgi:Fur family ferric uptake transcriptional regulator